VAPQPTGGRQHVEHAKPAATNRRRDRRAHRARDEVE